jgi:hypothetical protein
MSPACTDRSSRDWRWSTKCTAILDQTNQLVSADAFRLLSNDANPCRIGMDPIGGRACGPTHTPTGHAPLGDGDSHSST